MARRRSRGLWRALLAVALAPLLALVAALGVLLLDRETGLMRLAGLRAEAQLRRGKVADLDAQRIGLARRIERLRDQPLAVESEAREQLGMLRPGEIVVRWSEGTDRLD
jgi:cell division protein FtsB